MIYFIEAVGVGRVKVGKADDVKKRFASLNGASPVELRLLKSLPGYTAEETELHARWRRHRIKGEWFDLEALRSEIEALESIELLSVRRKKRGGVETVAVVACPACGEQREVRSRGEADGRKRERCKRCSAAENSAKGGEAIRAMGGHPETLAKAHAVLTERAKERWERDRLIAEANAVCVDCGKRLKVLTKGKYCELPDGVRTKRRCGPCGVSHGMRGKWEDPEYAAKMRARPTRWTPGAHWRDIVKAARTRASEERGIVDDTDAHVRAWAHVKLLEALKDYRRGLTAIEMLELANGDTCRNVDLREALTRLVPGDLGGIGDALHVGAALSGLRGHIQVLSDGSQAKLAHGRGLGRVGAAPSPSASKSEKAVRWATEVIADPLEVTARGQCG